MGRFEYFPEDLASNCPADTRGVIPRRKRIRRILRELLNKEEKMIKEMQRLENKYTEALKALRALSQSVARRNRELERMLVKVRLCTFLFKKYIKARRRLSV